MLGWKSLQMTRSYSELISIPSFDGRFEYLRLKQGVGDATFGSHRYLNQNFYRSPEWKQFRNKIILRDNACDLAHPDFEINSQPIYIHHINPITIDDILEHRSCVFDPENAVSTVFLTHQAIHYGDKSLLPSLPIERSPNDTCPWRK